MAVLFAGQPAWALPAPTANVTAFDVLGHRLQSDPDVRTGELVIVVVTGFPPLGAVTVEVPGTSRTQVVHANAAGVVRYLYRIPKLPNGQYQLVFIGPLRAGPTPSPSISSGPGDRQAFLVRVPTFGIFPFRVDDPSPPTGTPTPSPTQTGGAGAGGQGRHLSYTGVDVLAGIDLGGIVLLAGVLLLVLVRRRRAAHGGNGAQTPSPSPSS